LQQLKLSSLRMLGDLATFQGNYDQAISYYETGLEIDPEESLMYRRAIAQAKIDRGDVEAGLDELRALAVMNAGEALPWVWLALELWAQNNTDEAIENLQRATTLSTVDPLHRSEAFSYLHDIYREQNKLDQAEEAWKQAWQVMGRNMEDVSPLYQMYYEAGQSGKAQQWLKQEKNPLRAGFYRGLFAQADGAEQRARSAWEKTAKENPLKYQSGHEAWAEAALRVNHPPQAIIRALRDVNSREMLNIRGTILLAVALARNGQVDGAGRALQAAVDINRRARPPQDLLSSSHWDLFDELVNDEAAKETLKEYFEQEEVGGNQE
jgi:tetratricopeptide (TPR) repeat protein